MRSCWCFIVLSLAISAFSLQAGTPPEFLWAKSGGGSVDDYGNAVAVDSVGNSVSVGSFTGTGSFLGTNLISAGSDDIYLLRLDNNGVRVWAKRAGGTNTDEAYSVALDGSGNAYVAGRFMSTATFGSNNLVSAGSHDMFLAKYDVAGNVVWARRAGGTGVDYANGVATDPNGNVFVTGVFSNSATFGSTTLTSAGSKDIFIAKYDNAGNFLWARRAGSTGTDVSFSVATDSSGNAFIAGWFVFTADFSGTSITTLGSQDSFLAKYDANGNFLWVRQSGGSASYDYCYSVAVDAGGNPCISGSFRSTSTFSGTSITSSGSADIFLAKYSATGNFLWVQKAGAADASSPFKANDDEGYAVAVDSAGNAILTGYINGTATFSGTNLTSSSSYQDVFIAKYSTNGTLRWVQRAGGTGGSDYGNSIALDANANAYIAGAFYTAATFGTNNVTSVGVRDAFATKVSTIAVPTPPTISAIADKILNEDTASGAIPFFVGDAETPATNLVVVANSSNPALLPSLVLSGTGTNRTLAITPATNSFGTATVTITVTDSDGGTNSNNFLVTVNSVNDAPTLNAFTNIVVNEDSGPTLVNFSGITSGATNENQLLTVTATSSNPSLIPNPTVSYITPNTDGSLSFAPLANLSGSATITVTVQDDGGTANGGTNILTRTFSVTVNSVNDAPTLSHITDQTILQNASTGPLSFLVGDVETVATSLVVAGNSSNTNLIPNSRIVFGGSGNNRTVTISPATNQVGSATITLSVSDGATNVFDSFLVTVNPINTPPTITAITNRVTNEDTPTAAIPFIIGDAQTAATNLLVSASCSNTNLVPNVNIVFGGSGTNRTLVITPAANQFGPATMTITVTDSGGLTNSSAFLLTINSVNDSPSFSAISPVVINEDSGTNVVGLSGITSGASNENQTLTISAISSNPSLIPNPTVSYASPSATGALSFAPLNNANGSATITVTIQDDGGTTNGGTNIFSGTFLVTVNPVNDLPTISQISDQFINEDASTTSLPFVIGDVETAATNLVVSAISSNTNLVPNANVLFGGSGSNRTVIVSPVLNQSGSATITIFVNDGTTNVSSSFLLTVNPVNDTPTISALTNYVTNEDVPTAPIPFTVGDIETAATNLIVSAVSSDTNLVPNTNLVFSGTGTNRSLVITPFTNLFGASVITISVSDGTATTNNSFLLTVNAVNDAPTLNVLGNLTINEDSVTSVNLSGITAGASNENQFLTVTATSSNPSLIPNPVVNFTSGVSPGTTGSLSLTPLTNANGSATITVTVQDDGGTTNGGTNVFSRTFLVTVNPVNDAPTISHIVDQSIDQNTSTGPLAFVIGDIETAATNLIVFGDSSNTNLIPNSKIVFGGSGNNRTVTISPASNQVGSATITLSVNDGATSVSDSFLVTVNAVNSAPTISAITNRVTSEDTPTAAIPFVVGDNETAVTSLIVSASSLNTNLVPNSNIFISGSGTNRALVISPATNQFGSSVVTISVSDGLLVATASFLLTVNPVNDAPTALGDSYLVLEGGTLAPNSAAGVLTNDFDVETNSLRAILVTSPVNGTISLNTNGSFIYVHGGSETTNDSFTYKANDGSLDSAVVTVNISVTPVDDAPVAMGDSYTVARGDTLKRNAGTGVLANDIDAETNLLAAILVTAPTNGTLILGTNGSFTYFHNGTQMTNDSFTYKASDGVLDSGLAMVSLTVMATNHAPVLAPVLIQTVNEGMALIVTNSATDADPGDVLSYSMVAGPVGTSITSNGIFSWTPTEAQGPNTNVISIRVTDNGTPSMSSTNSFTVFVNEVNSAPIISLVTNQRIEVGKTLIVTNGASDSDIPGNAITFSLLSAPTGVTLTTNGVFSWTPVNAAASSTNTIVLRVTDNGVPNLNSTSSFVVVVEPLISDFPRIESPQYVAGNTKLSFTAQAGQPYRIDYAAGTNAPWFELMNISASPITTNLVVDDRVYDSNRIYRLVISESPTKIDRFTRNSEGIRVFFAVQAGRSYQVEGQDNLSSGSWTVLTNVTPAVSTNSYSYFDARRRAQQFYRLATPLRLAAFGAIQKSPSVFNFQFAGKAGTNYVVEYSQSITTNSWISLTNITPGVTTNVFVSDNAPPVSQRFYRVRIN